jgi:hypothetical protein
MNKQAINWGQPEYYSEKYIGLSVVLIWLKNGSEI